MALTQAHRARAHAILDGSHGADAEHTMEAERFHRARVPLERMERDACERAVQVVIDGAVPTEGHNNPFGGRDLSTYPLTVRVAYILTDAGDDDVDGNGEASGAGTLDAIEDRANEDMKAIRDLVGWQANWVGLDPSVIDPPPAGAPTRRELADRVIYEQLFEVSTRAALPGNYGPPLP